jgi:RAB protein geranylgeranyltransferase component A
MDTIDKTEWDVVIAGTGLPQSLLALYVPRYSLPTQAQAD